MRILKQEAMFVGFPDIKLCQIITSSTEPELHNSNQSGNSHIVIVNKYWCGYNTDNFLWKSLS